MSKETEDWDIVIRNETKLFRFDLKELWRYRDLIYMFVKRDLVAVYKQTVLGPLWHFIQPLLTTITFTFIFGSIAGLPADGLPRVLFYMSGIVLWGYFSDSLRKTSNTFIANSHIFSKVYFPRLVMPVSIIISSLFSFFVQLVLITLFWLYYYFFTDNPPHLQWQAVLLPVLMVIMALLGLGFGILISAMTTKYRDFSFLVGFGVQLMMYLSPVIYPMSTVPGNMKYVLLCNPMTPVIETFRAGFLGNGVFSWLHLFYSAVFALLLFVFSIILFNKVERNFTDTL